MLFLAAWLRLAPCGVCRVVLYAIAMADYNQYGADPCEKLITMREGIETIYLYSSSNGRWISLSELFLVRFGKPYISYYIMLFYWSTFHLSREDICNLTCKILKWHSCGGIILHVIFHHTRFANAEGAFIYPMYGHAELPQAFCRCAAVKGALYVRWSSQVCVAVIFVL